MIILIPRMNRSDRILRSLAAHPPCEARAESGKRNPSSTPTTMPKKM